MMQSSNTTELNFKENHYSFRFVSSNQLVRLTQQQLHLIPYLSALIAHKDQFLSIENEKGEYLLRDPIEYSPFVAILHSITSNNPYLLLDQLPRSKNVFNTLQLIDYLGVQSCSLPILKDVNLVRSNPDQTENHERVEYLRATLGETRQTAAQFVIGVAKNEYELDDPNTANDVFNLMNVILSISSVFSSSFRYHTFRIVRQCCYSFLSKDQKRLLNGMHRTVEYNSSSCAMYLVDDEKPVPMNFDNAFAWKSVPVTNDINQAGSDSQEFEYWLDSNIHIPRGWFRHIIRLRPNLEGTFRDRLYIWSRNFHQSHWSCDETDDDRKIFMKGIRWDLQKTEAQLARIGHFNTIPKRLKIDKFNHRCGQKAQKHR